MLHPSYVDLMKVVNKDVEEGEEPVISSRYSVVMATAKRARQIIAGDEPLIRTRDKEKPLSIAVRELSEDQIQILTEEEKAEMEERIRINAENDRIEEEKRKAEKAAQAEAEKSASQEAKSSEAQSEDEEA